MGSERTSQATQFKQPTYYSITLPSFNCIAVLFLPAISHAYVFIVYLSQGRDPMYLSHCIPVASNL